MFGKHGRSSGTGRYWVHVSKCSVNRNASNWQDPKQPDNGESAELLQKEHLRPGVTAEDESTVGSRSESSSLAGAGGGPELLVETL